MFRKLPEFTRAGKRGLCTRAGAGAGKSEVRLKKYFRDRISKTLGLNGVGGRKGVAVTSKAINCQNTCTEILFGLVSPQEIKGRWKKKRVSYPIKENIPSTLHTSR